MNSSLSYRTRPQTSFSRQRYTQSTILDKYATKEKLANSDIPRRVNSQYQREYYKNLSKILEDEEKNQKEFQTREILSPEEIHDQYQTEYHSFCLEFTKNASNYYKQFSEISKSAKSRSRSLSDQKKELEELERRAYRAEMKLPDPPRKTNKRDTAFVNQRTDFGMYDAKLSLSLANFNHSQT